MHMAKFGMVRLSDYITSTERGLFGPTDDPDSIEEIVERLNDGDIAASETLPEARQRLLGRTGLDSSVKTWNDEAIKRDNDEAALELAQTHTADFVAGLEIGQAVYNELGNQGVDPETLSREARGRVTETSGNFQALLFGAGVGLDEAQRVKSSQPPQ